MNSDKVNREILALSMPAIVSNITTPLLGLIDVAIVGHIGSAVYIAAIALGGTVMNMLYWAFGFLRPGASGVTAIAYGAGDRQAYTDVCYRGMCISLLLSLVLISLQMPLCGFMLDFFGADPVSSSKAAEYVGVCIWAAPAVLATYVLSGWMLGMQYSRGCMWVSIVTNISNIVASLIFVFALHYDIRGVALGTCIAQWIGLAMSLWLVHSRFRIGKPDLHRLFMGAPLRRFLSVNIDMFLRTLCLIAVTLWFTHAGASGGTMVLAANALLMQFFLLFSYFTDGFAFAGEALSGKYCGAASADMLHACIRSLFRIGAILSLVFTAAYFVAGDYILMILTEDTSVISTAKEYFIWVLTIPLAGFTAFTWDGIFSGLTRTRGGLLLPMALAALLFFILYHILTPLYGNHGLWASFVCYCMARGIFQTIYYRKLKSHIYRL